MIVFACPSIVVAFSIARYFVDMSSETFLNMSIFSSMGTLSQSALAFRDTSMALLTSSGVAQ
jgi:hypothetical protein